jgi:hypothetical protein
VSTGTINYGTTGTTGGPFAIVAVEITSQRFAYAQSAQDAAQPMKGQST